MPKVRSFTSVKPKVAIRTMAVRHSPSRVQKLLFFRHIPAHHHQHTGQRRKRNEVRQRRGDQHENQKKAACIIPATGLRAPARTLVAVRAIVPVTLIPPKKAEAILAMPWATSSML